MARVPLLFEETPHNTWRWSLPTFDTRGEGRTREIARRQAVHAIEEIATSWKRPVEGEIPFEFLNLSISPDTLALLDWQECQAISNEILGRQWKPEPSGDGPPSSSDPSTWSLDWPAEGNPEVRFRLILTPHQLGGDLRWDNDRRHHVMGPLYVHWWLTRIDLFVANADVWTSVCHELAKEPPSLQEMQEVLGAVWTPESDEAQRTRTQIKEPPNERHSQARRAARIQQP